MKKTTDIYGFIFALIVAVVFTTGVNATTYYSISNTEWSLTPGGTPISSSPFSTSGGATGFTAGDSLVIAHDVTINKLTLAGSIKVLSGASLTLVGNGFGSRIEVTGVLDIDLGGEVIADASDFDVDGTVNVNGDLTINSTATFTSTASIEGEGVINTGSLDVDFNGVDVFGTTVTGTLTSNSSVFVGTYNPAWTNVVWYLDGEFSSPTTDCSSELRVLSNLDSNVGRTVGKLVIEKGVNIEVTGNTTFQVCQDIANEGIIYVRTGSTLQVQGN